MDNGAARRNLVNWNPWRDGRYAQASGTEGNLSIYPMPMLTDMAFDEAGGLVLAFRDRRSDATQHFVKVISTQWGGYNNVTWPGLGVGELLHGEPHEGGWRFEPKEVHYRDRSYVFGDETRLQPLTGDSVQLYNSIGRIEVATLTCIHLGIAAAHDELDSTRTRTGNSRVIVVLTDGRNNPEPVSAAVAEAETAKAAGIRLFTVGLGEDVERDALRAMASRPEDFFHAPDGEDLLRIYKQIAHAIPCPGEGWRMKAEG